MLGLTALVIKPDIDEPITNERPFKQAMNHAKNKAMAVAGNLDDKALIIASDTVVYCKSQVLGKPETEDEACQYLNLLSGCSHIVYSAICLLQNRKIMTRYEKSIVTFQALTEAEIVNYIKTREPMDKAGAYGIQGFGAQFIERISGCYFNVMGFPVHLFYQMIRDFYKDIS